MGLKAAQFAAIVLTALALVPGGAHFFVLFNKIGLGEQQYFTVQSIYRGWSLFGIVLGGALVADLALAILVRRERAALLFALSSFLLMVVVLVVFFVWTFQPTRPLRTGPSRRPIGVSCAASGSTRMLRTHSSPYSP